MSKDEDNKRQYLRLPKPFRVQARELVFPIAKDPLITAVSNDLSVGGLCVESERALPIGTRLHVSVHIPLLNKFSSNFFKIYENDADQYFQAITDVMWVKQQGGKYLLGLKFINLDDTICQSIDKLITDAFRKLEKE